jgi:hypothetical protein
MVKTRKSTKIEITFLYFSIHIFIYTYIDIFIYTEMTSCCDTYFVLSPREQKNKDTNASKLKYYFAELQANLTKQAQILATQQCIVKISSNANSIDLASKIQAAKQTKVFGNLAQYIAKQAEILAKLAQNIAKLDQSQVKEFIDSLANLYTLHANTIKNHEKPQVSVETIIANLTKNYFEIVSVLNDLKACSQIPMDYINKEVCQIKFFAEKAKEFTVQSQVLAKKAKLPTIGQLLQREGVSRTTDWFGNKI